MQIEKCAICAEIEMLSLDGHGITVYLSDCTE